MTETVDIKRRPIIELGSWSSVASLAAIIIAIVTGTSKLNSINSHSSANCQLLASGIVLTLEASKARSRDNGQTAFLSDQQRHFEQISREC